MNAKKARATARNRSLPIKAQLGLTPVTTTITSPDGATRIVLYGLKLDTGGILLIEAGIRSTGAMIFAILMANVARPILAATADSQPG
jgi:hypothetical protein